jgi:hypothetical protein
MKQKLFQGISTRLQNRLHACDTAVGKDLQ